MAPIVPRGGRSVQPGRRVRRRDAPWNIAAALAATVATRDDDRHVAVRRAGELAVGPACAALRSRAAARVGMVRPMPATRPKTRLFLESRYRKLTRDLPQTIHYCPECKGDRRRRVGCACCGGRGRLSADSVQELLSRRLLPAYRARTGKFHGAGREDVDVRMLGRGRPFVFEIVAPRVFDVDLEALVERFHAEEGERVRIEPFRAVPRQRVGELKEAQFDKLYRATVELADDVDVARLEGLVGRELALSQRTPARVAHRRADLVRERRAMVVAVRGLAPRRVDVDVRTSHGTYVKEWVSGDDGRSTPSFAELCGVAASCAALDVLEVFTGEAGEAPAGNEFASAHGSRH